MVRDSFVKERMNLCINSTVYSRSQAAQAHYRNADVTLACEQCFVTNGYLQRLVWDVNGFFLKEGKMLCF